MELFANSRVGVGLEKWIPIFLITHSPRKIRLRFHGYKHTSLNLIVAEPSAVLLSSAEIMILVTVVVTLWIW
jgi:hypothetical protein